MSKVSIVIPCFNEEKYIATCIESIVSSNIDMGKTEILFIDGMSSDTTRDIINRYQNKYPLIKCLNNKNKIAPTAMNIGIKEAKGEYIFILSAHARYTKNYFKKLIQVLEELDAQCVGSVLSTEVKHSTPVSNSIKSVLSHPFGVGNASFRTGNNKVMEVDTVAFGCYAKKTFEKYGLFNEKLVRNQDIELNKRIVNSGGKIYLIPDSLVTYYARENLIDLVQNNYANGFWNILTAYYTKTLNSLSLRHFVPLMFVLFLCIPLVISFIYPKALWITFISLVSYLSLVILISFRLKNSSNSLFYLVLSFLTLHISYGIGSLIGIVSTIKKMIKGKK